mgnify:CR=1 FL=1
MRARRGPAALALCACLAACEARPASRLEVRALSAVKRRLTVGGRDDRNPLPDTPEVAELGRLAFSQYCVACHGLDGQVTGVPFAAAMSPPVPRLTTAEVQAYADGQLKWVIENGIFPSGMPAARGLLSDEEMWRIVLYLRHLPPAGSPGEPPLGRGGPSSTATAAPP